MNPLSDDRLSRVQGRGWPLDAHVWRSLSDYDQEIAEQKLVGVGRNDYSPVYYRRRLQMIGFRNLGRVLDAGCGLGHWTIMLAELNGFAVGIDPSLDRLRVGQAMAAGGATNAWFQRSVMECLPFAAGAFGGVFCYGAIPFSHVPTTLREFHRVLSAKGRLYFNIYSFGWLLHIAIDRMIRQRSHYWGKVVAGLIRNVVLFRGQNYIVSERRLRDMLDTTGFRVVCLAPEGHAVIDPPSDGNLPPPIYSPRHYGQVTLLEVVAEKR